MAIRGIKGGLAGCALVLFAAAASAADLPGTFSPTIWSPSILAPRPFGWTGCYVGGHLGGAWNDGTAFTDQGNGLFTAYSGGITHSWTADSKSSFIGGGTFGCNFQPIGPVVLGIEGEAGFMKLEGSAVDPRTSSDVLGSAKIGDWYAMITPRLGYAWDRTLLYVKAGVAFVPVQASVVDSCFSIAAGCNNSVISTAGSHTFTTYTVGGGLEWAFADRWSVKGEYMFIGLGNNKTLTTCGLARTAAGTVPGAEFCFGHEFRSVQTFKIGLNYLFGPL
jgi:outer membrane immunogenic protein